MKQDSGGFDIPEGICPKNLVNRNGLVSLMLQDRDVVRLLSAPHGFGKTTLAYEYATRLFAGKEVHWVDAETPAFLAALDAGKLLGAAADGGSCPDLLVLDDLCWLHEERVQTLVQQIDKALFRGAEVVVTTVPSCDCLRDLQSDRMLIGAHELAVSEQELSVRAQPASREGRARAALDYKRASATFMGLVPAVMWGDDADADRCACLKGLFSERLPHALFSFLLGMLLLGKGTTDELSGLGLKLAADDAALLAHDYPFMGMGTGTAFFEVPALSLAVLGEALRGTEVARSLSVGAVPLAERVLAILLDRGDMARARQVLEQFCPDRHCAAWLVSRGWDLLDQGQDDLVESLFARCADGALDEVPELRALRAWACGLQGDDLEACHHAQRLLAGGAGRPAADAHARMYAYLALAAFGDGETAVYGKETYASDADASTPDGFLACAVDLCSDNEVCRAVCVDDDQQRLAQLERARKAPSRRCEKSLIRLFTENHDRLCGTRQYRFALHLLEHVDSSEVRRLLCELGCDVVISARRSGLKTHSEALVVRDLWKNGFFGAAGPGGGKRDAVLLEGAARMLEAFARRRDAPGADIPWELGARMHRGRGRRPAPSRTADPVEPVYVRLFGCFEVTAKGHVFGEADFRRKARLALTILVVNQGRDVSRDMLLEQLWPDSTRVRALDNFYTVWSNIVASIGERPYLERNGDFCRINAHYVLSDVGEFEQLSRRLLVDKPQARELLDIYAHLESLYRGDLLPSERESTLVEAQRVRYRAMFTDSMVTASDCALKLDDARLALWFARKAVEADAHREDTYFALMKAQVAAGQRCSAIRTYFECRQFLKDELGLDPSIETEGLYDQLISTDPSLMALDPTVFRM